MVAGSLENGWQEVAEHAITSPLSEDGEAAVAVESVHRSLVLEQSTIIPPALVSTVHLKIFFVLLELQLDPDGLGVVVSVPFGENRDCLLSFSVDIKPSVKCSVSG